MSQPDLPPLGEMTRVHNASVAAFRAHLDTIHGIQEFMADAAGATATDLALALSSHRHAMEELDLALAEMKVLEATYLDRLTRTLPEGVDSLTVPIVGGGKATVKRAITEQFSAETGKADDLWAWIQENQRFDLVGRTLLKSGVVAAIEKEGKFPPFIQKVKTVKTSVTFKSAAP